MLGNLFIYTWINAQARQVYKLFLTDQYALMRVSLWFVIVDKPRMKVDFHEERSLWYKRFHRVPKCFREKDVLQKAGGNINFQRSTDQPKEATSFEIRYIRRRYIFFNWPIWQYNLLFPDQFSIVNKNIDQKHCDQISR